MEQITLEEQIIATNISADAAKTRIIASNQEIAGRIALMMAAGQAIDPDCVPDGYYIQGNTMMTVDGHPVAVTGHGAPRPAVDSAAAHMEAVNRSVAHLEGAAL